MNLAREVRRELTDRIIPFWKRLRDDEHGGYYGYMDFELKVDKEYEKGCILNSRILWFFANAYMTLKDKSLLAEAAHAYSFMRDCCEDKEYGGVFWSVTYDGLPLDTTKHIYNQAFAIYALSSYYAASNDSSALDFAMSLFEKIETIGTDSYGYLESFNRKWELEDNDKLSENGLLADKTMNTLLHVLEAYTELYRVNKDEKVRSALVKILDAFRNQVYNEKTNRLEVFFDEKMNTISDLYSYGHDIEASWLLDRAATVLSDDKIKADTNAYTNKLVAEVYNEALADGAMNNECFKGVVDTTRVWWVQAEAMVGFYNCYEKTGEEKYKDITEQLWDYIKNYIIDKREGSEWFWDLDKDNNPVSRKPIVEPWKCPYHNGRMCMEIIRRCL
ncbi:AGE family epimerase/isomerase [Agathobacter sp.]|uniref:AGE family epimerase/isomerase n=1 Tax=Agathobacter sp. TaxID=2021311 RepID=UPI00280BAEC8|nr:AGE family epimerase/isomerase [Agathobacter sp.]